MRWGSASTLIFTAQNGWLLQTGIYEWDPPWCAKCNNKKNVCPFLPLGRGAGLSFIFRLDLVALL